VNFGVEVESQGLGYGKTANLSVSGFEFRNYLNVLQSFNVYLQV